MSYIQKDLKIAKTISFIAIFVLGIFCMILSDRLLDAYPAFIIGAFFPILCFIRLLIIEKGVKKNEQDQIN